MTVKEQQEWRIPPSVSNWKNPKGYTLPLDKRLAADGRGLQSVHINEKFAKLAEALYIADRKAREQVPYLCVLQYNSKFLWFTLVSDERLFYFEVIVTNKIFFKITFF